MDGYVVDLVKDAILAFSRGRLGVSLVIPSNRTELRIMPFLTRFDQITLGFACSGPVWLDLDLSCDSLSLPGRTRFGDP